MTMTMKMMTMMIIIMCLPAKTTAVPTMPVRSPDTVICPGSYTRTVNGLPSTCSPSYRIIISQSPTRVTTAERYAGVTGRFATANRSRVSIRVAKNSGKGRGRASVVDHVKSFPHIYDLITMQNLVAVSHPVCEHVGDRENYLRGVYDRQKHAPPHVCYRTKYGRSRSNRLGVGICTKNFETLGPRSLETEACLTLGNTRRLVIFYLKRAAYKSTYLPTYLRPSPRISTANLVVLGHTFGA